MKNKMKAAARIAALAVVSAAGFAAAATAAQAQAWIELRSWSTPRVYDEAPVEVYREAPGYGAPEALPRRAVRRIVERQGFEVIGPIRLTGDVYIVPVEDMQGRVRRLVVDARDGQIAERAAGGPPRPPVDVGRARGRYADTPYATDLPPLPAGPRGWRGYDEGGPIPPPPVNERERAARERYARQFPDGAEAPRDRMDDFDVAPGLAPAPAPRAAEPRKSEPPKRATKKPAKARPKEANRTPVEKPAAQKPEPAKQPEAAKAAPAKPESAKAADPEKPTAKAEARKPDEKRNASILRRPGQKAETAKPDKGPGVAEAPTVSTGAEPQRKTPRVVYPGPGAPAPTEKSASDGE